MASYYTDQQLATAQKILSFNGDEISALKYALIYLKPKSVYALELFRCDDNQFKKYHPTGMYLKCLEWSHLENAAEGILNNEPYADFLQKDDFEITSFEYADRFIAKNKDIVEMIAHGLNSSSAELMDFAEKVEVVKKPLDTVPGDLNAS